MPGTKRPEGDHLTDSVATNNKQQRIDYNEDSPGNGTGGKKKNPGSTRTGQACDRCKIRKIRCDARPGGCSPCLQNNAECKTTDRITGRATSRGHTENLEQENVSLKVYLHQLQQQLRDSGVEPKPPSTVSQTTVSARGATPQYWGQIQSAPWEDTYNADSLLSAADRKQRQGSTGSLLPDFRPGCIGDNYLGVSSENNWLTSIEGTSLRLFGMKIDLKDFMRREEDSINSAMSYHTFLGHAFGRTRPPMPALPPYKDMQEMAYWYLKMVQPFIPILHRPDFMDLLRRVYLEKYLPTAAEKVCIHMVIAVMDFHHLKRNPHAQSQHDGIGHYHFALSLIHELFTGHTLEDVQALTLICSHLRSQTQPAAAWMFTNTVMGVAIESGLHRSATAWPNSGVDQDANRLEMRKRVFWTLLLLHVHTSGKLGRPMPLRLEDIDIEIPDALDDSLPEDPYVNKFSQCSFLAGIEGFKLLRIMHQVYSSIYTIKSTGQYETKLKQLGKELDAFQAQLPQQLRRDAQTRDDNTIPSLYLELSVAECQLLLHHPSLCPPRVSTQMNSNLDICLRWSGKLLSAATELKTLKCLDTNWFYSTDFLAAIFTTLFAYTERKDQMDSEDFQRLQQDMNQWLEIMDDVGAMLGTGPSLKHAVRSIIDSSFSRINRHLAAKTASAAIASAPSPKTEIAQAQVYDDQHTFHNVGYSNNSSHGDLTANHPSNYPDQSHTGYPVASTFNYPEAQTSRLPSYAATNLPAFDPTSGFSTATEESKPGMDARLGASISPTTHPNFMAAMQHPYQPVPSTYPTSHQAAWRNFTDSVPTNISGQEYMTDDGAAMMALGGSDKTPDGTNLAMAASLGNMHMEPGVVDAMNPTWPMMLYQNQGPEGGHG